MEPSAQPRLHPGTSLGQPRPEYGHCTNAVAVVGRLGGRHRCRRNRNRGRRSHDGRRRRGWLGRGDGLSRAEFAGQGFAERDDKDFALLCLQIYNDYFPMRQPGLWELKNWKDWLEVSAFTFGTFPEPLAFSLRAWDHLRQRQGDFDLVQDNQCLGYGLLLMERMGLPVLGTVHHPITVDRRLEMEHAESPRQRWSKARWYAFTKMQTRVAKRLRRVITVSRNSYEDICRDHLVSPERLHIVPVGVDPELFAPMPGVERNPNQIISTASSDVAMKGQRYLLEALAKLRTEFPDLKLIMVGRLKEGSAAQRTIETLGLDGAVEFVSGVPDETIVELYNSAACAVVPSLYEGFSLPAVEAMSSGTPIVASRAGALPEVLGSEGLCAELVKPGDAEELTTVLRNLLDSPERRYQLGIAGRQRAVDVYSWESVAAQTVSVYQRAIERSRAC